MTEKKEKQYGWVQLQRISNGKPGKWYKRKFYYYTDDQETLYFCEPMKIGKGPEVITKFKRPSFELDSLKKLDHQEFSRRGAMASHKAQFRGMTKEEISEHMRKVRTGNKKK